MLRFLLYQFYISILILSFLHLLALFIFVFYHFNNSKLYHSNFWHFYLKNKKKKRFLLYQFYTFILV